VSRRQRPVKRARRRPVAPASPPDVRGTAYGLIRSAALGEAAHHGREGLPPADWAMYGALTGALEHWHAEGELELEGLALIEWLSVELAGYLHEQCGRDRARVERWLLGHGDRVGQAQMHAHPAGPTAVEILAVMVDDSGAGPASRERLLRLAAPYLAYVREGHEVEDVRELSLTIGMWAGQSLAALMHHDTGRIRAYVDALTAA